MIQHQQEKSSNIKPKPAIAKKPANIPKVNYQLPDGGPPKSILKKKSLYDTDPKNGNCVGNTGNSNNGSKTSNGASSSASSSAAECKGAIRKNKCEIPSSPNLCANDCCGISIKIEQKLQQHKHQPQNNNQCNVNNGPLEAVIASQNGIHKKLKTPTGSFDSSSSSSGGFQDANFLTRTKDIYEKYDKIDNFVQQSHQHIEEPPQSPVSNNNNHCQSSQSKILELQSKLIAQQNCAQNNDIPTIPQQTKNIQQTSQYQKSSKQLEQVLALRIEKENRYKAAQQSIEKIIKRPSQQGFEENNISAQLGAEISKKIQQKLQEEMKQQCKAIKDKFLIEKVPVQQHYNQYLVGTQFIKNLK